ncbi:MAG: hypothetical protein CK531_10940 [Gemmatimonadetes bacterium]|nr:MAG: hypothetical protein CK531_10940 [Gemmatimonadota bacterium]
MLASLLYVYCGCMPLSLTAGAPTIIVRREAFERTGLSREAIDRALVLTSDEFRVERDLIAIGPIYSDDGLTALVQLFEASGLSYFEDFFEMSGNWPEWLALFSMSRAD